MQTNTGSIPSTGLVICRQILVFVGKILGAKISDNEPQKVTLC
jgi:hypothetical protein